MKRLLTFGLVLGAIPSFGQPGQIPVTPIAVYTSFRQAPPKAVMEALRDEVESIMTPIGLQFEWRTLNADRGSEVAVELAVVTFKGRCVVEELSARSIVPGALGWTHMSDGAILPFSDVDCDRIRGFVQKELLKVAPEDREETFGRAVGRVLAHELYHIFANTTQHGSCGVGKAAYSVSDLLSDDFQFEARDSRALRASKAHAAMETFTAN